jgi:hypothetical protein
VELESYGGLPHPYFRANTLSLHFFWFKMSKQGRSCCPTGKPLLFFYFCCFAVALVNSIFTAVIGGSIRILPSTTGLQGPKEPNQKNLHISSYNPPFGHFKARNLPKMEKRWNFLPYRYRIWERNRWWMGDGGWLPGASRPLFKPFPMLFQSIVRAVWRNQRVFGLLPSGALLF